jgi:hypothetical protein
MLGLIPVSVYRPGGTLSSLNMTTAGVVIKSSPGCLYRAVVNAGGTTTDGSFTFNDSNAYVTAQTITAITQASSAVVTVSTGGGSNPFAVGNTITFTSVGGMTQINGQVGTVTAIGGVSTAWTITTSINSSSFSAFTSGGTCASFGAGNEILNIPALTGSSGVVYFVQWPCANGILLSSVPTAGSPIIAAAYV